MKASELMRQIQALIDEFGDLDIGIHDSEFNAFDAVGSVYLKEAETGGSIYTNDFVSDAGYFIAID